MAMRMTMQSSPARRWSSWVMLASGLGACGLGGCDGSTCEPIVCDGGHAELDGGAELDAGELDAGPIAPALSAVDQTLALSTVVTIAAVASDGPGWVVVHEDGGGIIGLRALPRARHVDVQVALDRRARSGETLRAVLHLDAGVIGAFEPTDEPVRVDGIAVEASFSVTVEDDTPDVHLSLLNIGDASYVFLAAEPERYAVTDDPEAENPSITLRRGWRYEVFNPANVSHPFQLIRAGDGFADEVHVSQRAGGTLDEDASVRFDEVSPSLFRFTVSPSLEAVVDAYRCLIHPHMRGSVGYTTEP